MNETIEKVKELSEVKAQIARLTERKKELEAYFLERGNEDVADTKYKSHTYADEESQAADLEKFLKSLYHTPGVAAVGNEEIISAIVSLVLLFLREFGTRERFAQRAELRVGECGSLVACRCYHILGCAGEQLLLEGILAVMFHHVTYLMTDDTHQLVVSHNVHER